MKKRDNDLNKALRILTKELKNKHSFEEFAILSQAKKVVKNSLR